MPKCGSQCFLCDYPVRFDTYEGCSHACEYCFAKKFQDISKIKNGESYQSLKNFIEGKRVNETNWCDWNIPIHWGGMSDPFQPVEKTRKNSLKCLELLKQTQYPFIVSTKGKLIIEEPYKTLLSECNCVLQISAVCSSYDKIELGCPTYEERVKIASIMSKQVKRVIIRIQPYMHEVFQEVYDNLEKLADAGVYGVIIEGMKYKNKKAGLVKVAGDFTYHYEVIKSDFLKLKARAHELGLKIYSGENRLRIFGDSLSCCGTDGLDGFKPNKFNLNHLLNGDKQFPTELQKKECTGGCFRSLVQSTDKARPLMKQSFAYNMLDTYKKNSKKIDETFGIDKRRR